MIFESLKSRCVLKECKSFYVCWNESGIKNHTYKFESCSEMKMKDLFRDIGNEPRGTCLCWGN